ncbi:MAG: Omp28-related outer membrane protein [Bacteroidetes bacterium]|nr:Omp28-related outer membrane protein [Bacteroidota bacterium]
MKKTNYLFIIFTFYVLNLSAQNVEQKQMALMSKKTATWCNPCGTWGWTLFNDIWVAKKDVAVIFELHNSTTSQLYSPNAATMYSYFDLVSSTPAFYVNGKNETQYSTSGGIYTTSTKNRVFAVIDSISNLSPVVNAGFNTNLSNDTLYIDTKVKFFQNTTGEYYLGVYLSESNVIKYQNGIGNTAVHKQPMRVSVSPNVMGDLIVNGPVTANTEFTNSFSYKLNAAWIPANVNVFTVIWKKVGTDYEYVNAYKVVTPTGINENEATSFNSFLYPNAAGAGESVNLIVKNKTNENVTIEIFDQLGKQVQTVFEGKLTETENQFEINQGGSLNSGLYFVSVTSSNGNRKTLKLMITK